MKTCERRRELEPRFPVDLSAYLRDNHTDHSAHERSRYMYIDLSSLGGHVSGNQVLARGCSIRRRRIDRVAATGGPFVLIIRHRRCFCCFIILVTF